MPWRAIRRLRCIFSQTGADGSRCGLVTIISPSYNSAVAVSTRLVPPARIRPTERPPRRHRQQSRIRRRRLHAHRRCADAVARRHARRDLRPAARLPIRRAGQHDRDAARQRLPPQGAGVLALQRDARADRGDAAARRRDGDRSPGHRRAHLHLHLHDGELPARLREARRRHHRLRSAESDRRRRRRRADAGRRATSRSSGSFRSRCVTA